MQVSRFDVSGACTIGIAPFPAASRHPAGSIGHARRNEPHSWHVSREAGRPGGM